VADFCELLCSLWFFNDDVWVQSAANGFLPLLVVFYAWTTDIAYSTTVIWFGALTTLVYSGFGCISVKNQCFWQTTFSSFNFRRCHAVLWNL